MTDSWRRCKRRRHERPKTLGEYTFTSQKAYDPGVLLTDMVEAVPSVHAIEMEKGRLTVRCTMPRNDTDRRALLRVMRKHKAGS